MKKFAWPALALVLLSACGTPSPAAPAQVTLEVSTSSRVQNVLNVSVNVTGEGVRQVTLSRQNLADSAPLIPLKQVTQVPFSFTFGDTVPGNGRYLYRVTVLNGEFRTEVDREVTYTYSVGQR